MCIRDSRHIGQGLGQKGGKQAVAGSNGLDHRFKGQKVVGAGNSIAKLKIDLILPRSLLMVGGLGLDPHFLQA